MVGVRQVVSRAEAPSAEAEAGSGAMDTATDDASAVAVAETAAKRAAAVEYTMGSTRIHYPVAGREMMSPFKNGNGRSPSTPHPHPPGGGRQDNYACGGLCIACGGVHM